MRPRVWFGERWITADGAVGLCHVVAGSLHLLPVGVGLLVDHLEVTASWVMNPWQAAEPAPPQKSLAVNTSEMMA